MAETTWELLLFDLDGTLLGPDRRIRSTSITALRALMDRGLRVGFATGRSPASVRPYLAQLAVTGPSIVFNGAMVWDHERDEPSFQQTLPRADAWSALRLAAELGIHVNLYLDDRVYNAAPSATATASMVKDGLQHEMVGDLGRFLAGVEREPIKIMLIDASEQRLEAFMAAFSAAATAGCTLVRSEPTYLEILAPGVHKGAALGHIEARHGIAAARTMVFGDQLNDVELVRRSGLGVAMANAHPELKQVADVVIGRHDEDAISTFLTARMRYAAG